ncbi:MAG: YdcF family protein [Flavobacteriales bacterium]|nr:YdcF family protein [Flavobacteriales bacterium]
MLKWIWEWGKRGFLVTCLLLLSIYLCNIWIVSSTEDKLFSAIKSIPKNDVGLVLGASLKTRRGNINLYFKYRMEAAAKLYHAGKIKHILVSGDNHHKSYDESTDMKEYLVKLGVPAAKITLDYAGFRTLDSVVRSNKVFGQKSITIISQEFHNQRAVFIATKNGIDAVGFNAKSVPHRYGKKTVIREYIAKFKAVLDIYVLWKQPKFLGEPVQINT